MVKSFNINIPFEEFEAIQKQWIKDCLLNFQKDLKQDQQTTAVEYKTREEMCRDYHLSPPTLNKYTKKGIFKKYTVGSRVLYKTSEVEEAISRMSNLKTRQDENA